MEFIPGDAYRLNPSMNRNIMKNTFGNTIEMLENFEADSFSKKEGLILFCKSKATSVHNGKKSPYIEFRALGRKTRTIIDEFTMLKSTAKILLVHRDKPYIIYPEIANGTAIAQREIIRKALEQIKIDLLGTNLCEAKFYIDDIIEDTYLVNTWTDPCGMYEMDKECFDFMFIEYDENDVPKEIEPANNDGRSSCYWCNSQTKKVAFVMATHDICTKCGR